MKKTVAIVGAHKGSRDLAPWNNKEIEIWGMNELYNFGFMKRWDRWFQIHSRELFTRKENHNDPNHYEWLKKAKCPIYMQREYEDIPTSRRYPKEEIVAAQGGQDYFVSTAAYMIALAIYEQFERIELYGISMSSDIEYKNQRANGEYWLGFARGRGIEVTVPLQSSLLKGTGYGYDDIYTALRQKLEYRYAKLKGEEAQIQKTGQTLVGELGAYDALKEKYPELGATAATRRQTLQEMQDILNVTRGARLECETQLRLFDSVTLGEEHAEEEES